MLSINKFERTGNEISVEAGKLLVEAYKNDPVFKESFNFREDNGMTNSADLYTTVLSKAIWYKSYDTFDKYYENVVMYTPADLGLPAGAGVYKIPKINGAVATKVGDGEVMDYTNDDKDSILLETETYGVATRINRRLIKRAALGAIEKFMKAASDGVHRAVCTDIVNGMIAGVTDSNRISTGISYDTIEEAKQKVRDATTSKGARKGFVPDVLALTSTGWTILAKSSDYKTMVFYGQRNVPGEKANNEYSVFNGLNVVMLDLATATKSSKVVHGLVYDKMNFFVFFMETEMETFDGRIQGTPGDIEVIHALDAGMAVLNEDACSIITAA